MHFFLVLLEKSLSKLATMCCVFETSLLYVQGEKENCPNGSDCLLKTKQCTTDIILDSSSYFTVSIVLKTRCHGLHHMRIKFLHPAKQVKEVYFPVMSSDQLARRGTKTTRLA